MVVGSRKGLPSASWYRGLGKRLIRMLANFLMDVNVHDINSGMKIYDAALAQRYAGLRPGSMAFSDVITLVFISEKHRVCERPIRVRERQAGRSTITTLTAAYSNHFDNAFHFDDAHVIVNNLSIRSLANTGSFFTDARTFTARPQNAVYRPLLTLSYAIDFSLGGGLSPRQFHLTQFGLLLLLGGLLVWLYTRLFDLGEASAWNRYAALFAAAWFCIHTANTETVNYLSSRSSLIATLAVVAQPRSCANVVGVCLS